MGVPGLWDLLRSAGQTRSLTHLAVVDGFEKNTFGYRGFRVGIDASIWFFHAAYGREGENPELRTLFFRCARLLSLPFLPLFVFDGPKRPSIKRNKRVTGNAHWLTNGMKNIIEAFGFEWKIAPGEAEAELALLNKAGIIDAVLSDDVDTFLFGATVVVRNPNNTLSGNRAHPNRNASGKDDGNHAVIYRSKDFKSPEIDLTQGGLILIAILSGGDYHQAGLPRCGPAIAHGLAKCGFGDSLLHAARTMSRADLCTFLQTWRQTLRDELRTNSRKIIGRKNPSLANSVPVDFPDIDILLSYTNPITSESEGKQHQKDFVWDRKLDLGRIAHICELYFEWGVRSVIIKRFRNFLWPAAVLRFLREAALLQDGKSLRREQNDKYSTDEESPDLILQNLEKTIVKIHSSRNHASTDCILEYRLEIAPTFILRSAEAGIKDIRPPLIDELQDEDDEDSIDNVPKRGGKTAPDPLSNFRIWIPACMVQMVVPSIVDEFQDGKRRQGSKKAKKLAVTKSQDDSGAMILSKKSRGPEQANLPKEPHLKDFYVVKKKGISVSGRQPKATKVAEDILSQTSSSDTIHSKIIKALDNLDTVATTSHSVQKTRLTNKPLPVIFDSDSDDLFVNDENLNGTRRPRSSKLDSGISGGSPEKSPRKSTKHTSPRSTSHARTPSPSPLQPRTIPQQVRSPDVIEIPSESDEELVALKTKQSVAPLLIAKARTKSRTEKLPGKTSNDIIDLT